MKVLLIGNYLPDQQESMQRFAKMLEVGLSQLGHEVRLLQPTFFFGRLKPSATGIGKWLGYLDKFLIFPTQLRQAAHWADVVHICDHSNAFYTKYLQAVPHIATCNDLLAIRSALGEIPQNPTRWTGRQLQQMILVGLEKAQYIACISKQTKQDLTRLVKLRGKASVIYMGLNYPYSPMPQPEARQRLQNLGVSHMTFFLHVGGNQWYKNRLGVLEIFRYVKHHSNSLELNLVMAGKPFTAQMGQFIQENDLGKQVLELVAVNNEDLRALYSTAMALLFPSLQEGFGWPIAEAQACGCPVFTSDRAPMTEVGGDAAIYIDPDQPQAAATEIAQQLPHLDHLTQIGLENAKRFSARQMVESYAQIYQEVCQ